MTTNRRRWVVPLVTAAALVIMTLGLYARAMNNGYVHYDDDAYVYENAQVRRGLSWDGVRWAFTTMASANWHPVTWLSHQLDGTLFGMNPRWHHLTNVVFHAASTALLLYLLRGMTGTLWPGVLVAALFAVHPLHVESVAWLAERKDVLSAFFFMLTLMAWTKYVRSARSHEVRGHDPTGIRGHDPNSGLSEMGIVSPRTPTGIPGHDLNSGTSEMRIVSQGIPDRSSESNVSPGSASNAQAADSSKSQGHDPEFHEDGNRVMSRIFMPNGQAMDSSNSQGHDPGIPHRVMSRIFTPIRWYILSLALFALGLMAKPMLVTLPFLLLLLDLWPLGRLAPGTCPPGGRLRRLSILVAEKLPFLALSAASSVVTFIAQKAGGAVGLMETHHQAVKFANAAVSYARYLGSAAWPSGLAMFYPLRGADIPWWSWGGSILLVAAVSLAVALAWRRPYLGVGWFWYVGMLVPVIGLIQVGGQSHADRYTYLPLTGIFVMIAWGGRDLLAGLPRGRTVGAVLAIAWLAVLAPVTWRQITYWENPYTLFGRTLAVTKNNWMAHNNFGLVLNEQGRLREAEYHLRESLRIQPGVGVLVNLGNILDVQGQVAEGRDFLRRALSMDPMNVAAHYNLGNSLARDSRFEEAAAEYQAALRVEPGHADSHNNLAVVLGRLGRTGEAIEHFRTAVRLNPRNVEARNNLGVNLYNLGRVEEAIAEYRAAIALRPGYVASMVNLADALFSTGRGNEAAGWYREVLRRDPANQRARTVLPLLGG